MPEQAREQDDDLRPEHLPGAGELDDPVDLGVDQARHADAGHAVPRPTRRAGWSGRWWPAVPRPSPETPPSGWHRCQLGRHHRDGGLERCGVTIWATDSGPQPKKTSSATGTTEPEAPRDGVEPAVSVSMMFNGSVTSYGRYSSTNERYSQTLLQGEQVFRKRRAPPPSGRPSLSGPSWGGTGPYNGCRWLCARRLGTSIRKGVTYE